MKNNLLFIESISKDVAMNYEVSNQLSKNFSGLSEEHLDIVLDSTPDLRLNKNMFRSDDFLDTHDGRHILFSGCSTTFGFGLLEEELWTAKLSKLIELNGEKISGYFNLAKPGTGIFEIVSNIFKYCNSFGTPDVIFVQIPNINRFYAYDLWTNSVRHADLRNNDHRDFTKQQEIYAYQYLMMLEIFCKSNDIDLVIFTWPTARYFTKAQDLESLHFFSVSDLERSIKESVSEKADNSFFIEARDGEHHGTAYHDFWAKEVFILYNEIKKSRNGF